jgi:hypothetical protein
MKMYGQTKLNYAAKENNSLAVPASPNLEPEKFLPRSLT